MSDKNKENSDSSTNWKDYELLEETKKLRTAKSTLYVPKKDRYEDASSSAFIFTIFGVVGDVVVILTILGILHLPIANNIISQIAMIGLFSFFLFVGITSWKKARFLKTELEDNLMVCPHCDYHFRINARKRINQLFDEKEKLLCIRMKENLSIRCHKNTQLKF